MALRAPFLDKALLEPCLAASFQQSPSAPANLGSVRWGNAHDAPAFGANSDDLNTILNTMEQAVRAEAPITPAATAADSAAPALSSDDAAPAAHHEALTLSLLPEYDTYPSEAGTIARMVVSLKAGMVGKARAPVSLTCVLDRSGSMSGPRLTLLRETVSFLIEQLGSDDLLGLVSYSDSVLEDLPLVGMSAGGKALAHAVVARLQASGGTALYAGTLAGLQQQSTGSVRPSPGNSPSLSQLFGCPPPMTARPMRLDSAATVRYDAGPQPNGADTATLATPAATGDNAWCKGYVRAVLLCTDGEATHGPRSADDMLPALRREQEGWSMGPPLTLHTFGIGSGHDARLLQAMSESQAGQYYDIASAADIPETYGDVLGGLLSVVAKDVQLSIMPASGSGLQLTALQCGGKVTQPATTDGGAHQVAYGDVFAEESKDAMLMLKLPSAMHATGTAAGPAEVLLTVTLSYTNCNSGGAVNAEQAVHVLRGVRPQNAEACEEVLVTAARYATADALRAATAAAASGQQAQAQQVMQQQTAALQALHSRVSTTAGVAGLLPSAGIAGGSLGMVNMLLATAQSGYQQVQQVCAQQHP